MSLMEIDTSWKQWEDILGTAKDIAEALGMSEDNIKKLAYRVGNILAKYVDPGNPEQDLICEIWDVAKDDERKILASLIVRLVDKDDIGSIADIK